uniref:Uncharacterized protein n=1 Tax=viral metagenome TaxID=1070528 RepID=A0A6C0KFG9_9ZZZZ
MDNIVLIFRNKSLNISLSEVHSWSIEEWYIPNLILFDKELRKEYNIFEDFNTAMSIIESIRHRKLLILSTDVNIHYLKALAKKWTCPEWLIDAINNQVAKEGLKKHRKCNSELLYIVERLLNPVECKKCGIGYDYMKEHNENECKFHSSTLNLSRIWNCCGSEEPASYCKQGYHIPNIDINLIINKLKD